VIPVLLVVLAAAPAGATAAQELDRVERAIAAGEYASALAQARTLATAARRGGDVAAEARALMLEADVHYYQDRRDEMRRGYQRALDLYRGLGDDAGTGRAYYSLAYYYERTQPERMIALLDEGIACARRAGDRRLEMNVENALGQASTNRGRYADAAAHFERSRAIADALGETRAAATALTNIGAVAAARVSPSASAMARERSKCAAASA